MRTIEIEIPGHHVTAVRAGSVYGHDKKHCDDAGCSGDERWLGHTVDLAVTSIEQLGSECAQEAWARCSPDMRASLSGDGAGEEPGSIEALADLVGQPTREEWRRWVRAYDERLSDLRGEAEA